VPRAHDQMDVVQPYHVPYAYRADVHDRTHAWSNTQLEACARAEATRDEPIQVRYVVVRQEELAISPAVELERPVTQIGGDSTFVVHQPVCHEDEGRERERCASCALRRVSYLTHRLWTRSTSEPPETFALSAPGEGEGDGDGD
jgi:hypothetical protein